ncbi:MAG TPA: HNH endonuclease signature motif containing protein [Candidatus Tectomicrobia bacterium]
MSKMSDLVGQSFNLLSVMAFADVRNGRSYWVCICQCGEQSIVNGQDLKRGKIKSCGCLRAPSIEERFWNKVEKTSECWLWTGSRHIKGYGRLMGIGKTHRWKAIPAHRLSWVLHYGSIPQELGVLHHCDNPPCVRPDHLFLGTPADNVADKVRKSRQMFGDRHVHAKINTTIAAKIKEALADGEANVSISRRFNVSKGIIRGIKIGRNWKHA